MKYVLFLFAITDGENEEEKDKVICPRLPTSRC